MNMQKLIGGKLPLKENVEFELRDKNGNIKPLFQENLLSRFLIKHGLISPNSQLYDKTSPFSFLLGKMAQKKMLSNLVVTAGKAGVASRINGSGGEAAFTYIAMGTGTNAAAAGDTALQTELATSGLSRAAATASRVTTTVTNDTAQLQLTFTITGSAAVTESGVLNAGSGGTLLARQVFSAINVVNGDTLTITWKFQVS